MIIYQASKSDFVRHAFRDDIEDTISRHYLSATGRTVGKAEVQAWKHSLLEMARVLQDEEIPGDAGVAIEYQLPRTSKRIDVIITGQDEADRPKVVIVELKQWSKSRRSAKDAIIWAHRGGRSGEQEGPHPSYQAWSYAAYLEDFNAAVQDGGLSLQPCAYLHNHQRDGEIDHPHYAKYLELAPLFLKKERAKLRDFIRRHVRYGDKRGVLYDIESGRIRPSKMLMDNVAGLLQGKVEFALLDDQKVVFESILEAESRATKRKQVIIVQGGPGTGKSVLAVNLLAKLLAREKNARYVSKNAAPRSVYQAKLAGTLSKTRISNLFTGSGAYIDDEEDTYDALIVDEAHRLNEKSGLYGNLGENQVKELIRSSRCTVFFVDDDQRVTISDIGHTGELRHWAGAFGADLTELELSSQFRCNGSDGYLAWLDDVLEVKPTANNTLASGEFDFRVFDSARELHDVIELKNRVSNRARVVAGYCWPWRSKKDPVAWDIELPDQGYRRRWNLAKDGSLWIVSPDSVDEVGCIHTCQGLELDFVGVIIGPDLAYRNGTVVTDAGNRSTSDQSVKGLKRLAKENPEEARTLADRIIKNTYRTLMSRGMKGCYVFCTDKALADHFRSHLQSVVAPLDGNLPKLRGSNIVPFRRVTADERAAGVPSAPVFDLKIAAGRFAAGDVAGQGAHEWAALPEWIRSQPGLFVAQVIGESMNRRIPNGAWCLFRANPAGSREGKIVVVQHRSIEDPETGGSYTVKVYSSEKIAAEDGGWRHRRITLHPDSDQPEFKPIVLEMTGDEDSLHVLAEMLTVLPPAP